MLIFHGLFQHDSRLHDRNRFLKPHTNDTLLHFSITFEAFFCSSKTALIFEHLWRGEVSLVSLNFSFA